MDVTDLESLDLKRPFTTKCKSCHHWSECDWFEMIEAIEDAAMNHSGETGWLYLEQSFDFQCQEFADREAP